MLYSKNQFSRQKNRPKPAAFDPSPNTSLSVVHITRLSDGGTWELARNTLGSQPGRDKIYARVDIPVAQLIKQNLRAIRDDMPFVRHTSVLGWPSIADPNERKERWKEICLALSEGPELLLVIPATPIVRLASEQNSI